MDWLFHTTTKSVRVREHVYIREDEMNKFRGLVRSHTLAVSLLSIGFLCATLCGARFLRAQSDARPSSPSDDALIAEFRRVEVASVSDALEQLTGKRWYMSHL